MRTFCRKGAIFVQGDIDIQKFKRTFLKKMIFVQRDIDAKNRLYNFEQKIILGMRDGDQKSKKSIAHFGRKKGDFIQGE